MRPIRLLPYLLLLLLGLLLPSVGARAQAPAGKEFIVTLPSFLPTPERNSDVARFMVEIMCPRRTQVTVKWSDGSPFSTADVQAGTRLVLMKPMFHIYQIMQSSEELDVEKINRRAWVITTDQPVTVQALFDTNYRAENWMIYPTSTFDTAYTLVNYAGYGGPGGKNGMIVMAKEDNTVVRITPAVQTWGAHFANVEYSITLNKYQVYEVVGTYSNQGIESDMTGTRIRSNRPVGILSFSHGSSAPTHGKPTPPAPSSPLPRWEYDYSTKLMAEHQAPESYAGTTFYMMPYLRKEPSQLEQAGNVDGRKRMQRDTTAARFMVLSSPTTFDTNGVRLKGRGGNDSIFFRGMYLDLAFCDPTKVEASKPVLAATFMASGAEPMMYDTTVSYDTVVMQGGVPTTITKQQTIQIPWGNPSMIWLPPTSLYRSNLQIAIPNMKARPMVLVNKRVPPIWRHFLVITAPATAAGKVTLNGNPVTFNYTFGDGKYVSTYARMLPGLRYVIESPEPISAISYGLTHFDSYGTTAGESVLSKVSVIPDTLRFFSCDVEKDTSITLTNSGSGGFRIDSFTVSGVAATLLQPAYTPPYIYGGSMTDRLVFRFSTPTPGIYRGTIRLYTDANNQAIFDVPFIITRDSAMLGVPGSTIDLGALKSTESSRDTAVVLRNNGSRPLVITAVSFVGQGYQLVGATLPDTIAPGRSDTLLVRFTPSGDGLREAEMRIAGTPCLNAVNIHLRAFKGSGATVLVARRLEYGSYLCTIPASVDSVIELRSIGDEPVVISGGTIDGAQKDEFQLLDALSNVTVLPGDTLRIHVRYTPSGSGERRAVLKLTTNAKNGGSIDIELVARRDTAALEAATDTVRFGAVLGCDGALEQMVRVRNSGTVPDTLTAADLAGAGGFTVLDALPVVVQPGTEQELRVRFLPTADGPQSATLKLRGAPCDVQTSVQLAGERQTARFEMAGLDGGAIRFDTVYECEGRQRRSVVLHNSGPVADTLYSLSESGGSFTVEGRDFPIVIGPGARDTVEVTFTPPGAGDYSAQLTALWGPCAGTTRLDASATSASASIGLSAGTISFDSVALNGAGHARVVIVNRGTAPRRVTGIDLNGPAELKRSKPGALPAEIAPGDSLELELEWRPTAKGTLAAQVTLHVASPCGGDTTLAVSGEAVGDRIVETSLTLVAPVTDGEQDRPVELPIEVENWTNVEAASPSALRFRLSWRYTVLAPLTVTTPLAGATATIVEDVVEGSRRRVTIQIAGGAFPANGEVARLRGLMLVGDTDRTPLELDSIALATPPNRVVTAAHRDGELRVVGICRTGGDRYVVLNGGVRLKALRPNPFREGAVIEFESDVARHVGVRIYDSFGRQVAQLADGEVTAGTHSLYFAAGTLPSGVYICELESNGVRQRAALVLAQ